MADHLATQMSLYDAQGHRKYLGLSQGAQSEVDTFDSLLDVIQ